MTKKTWEEPWIKKIKAREARSKRRAYIQWKREGHLWPSLKPPWIK